MQAAHTSVLQYSTSVLHSISTTALLDKGHQVCKQPYIALPLMLLKSTTLDGFLPKHACKQHIQVCCTSLAPKLGYGLLLLAFSDAAA